MSINQTTFLKVDAELILENSDTAVSFGSASGNCISPPEIEKRSAEIMVELDENDLVGLVDGLEDGVEIDRDYAISAKVVGNKVRIYFGVIGLKTLRRVGGLYDRLP